MQFSVREHRRQLQSLDLSCSVRESNHGLSWYCGKVRVGVVLYISKYNYRSHQLADELQAVIPSAHMCDVCR